MHLSMDDSIRSDRRRELQSHLGHLDALRGIAVLGVILIHTGQAFHNDLYEYVNNPGMRGVQLFFVVSAFTLLLSSDRRKSEPRPVLSFFLRRYFRLAPLCYPMIVLAYFTVPQLHALGLAPNLFAFTFLHDFFPSTYNAGTYGGWSLGVETIFYLCFPFLLRHIRNLRSAVLWLFSVSIGSTLIWIGMYHWHHDQFPYWSYFSYVVEAPIFLFGFVAFFLWRDYLRPIENTERGKWASAALLFLTLTAFINVVPVNGWKTMPASIFCVTLLLAVALYQWRFLVNRVTIYLGKVSYSMYLIHGALVWTVVPRLKQHFPALNHDSFRFRFSMLAYLVIVAISAALGWITWTFIEEPGVRLGKLVVRRVQGRSAATVRPLPPLSAPQDTPSAQF